MWKRLLTHSTELGHLGDSSESARAADKEGKEICYKNIHHILLEDCC